MIGRVFEDGKVIAYKLYDADSKEVGLYPRENVHRKVKEGIPVIGLRAVKGGGVIHIQGAFNMSKVDNLNGKGHPIRPTGNYTLLGYSGFLEDTKYRLVNSEGFERIVTQDEFKQLVYEDKVNGAMRSKGRAKNEIVIYRLCDYREYNY